MRLSSLPHISRLAPATAAALAAVAAAPAVGNAAETFGSDLKSPTTIDDGCEGPRTCTRLLFSIDGKEVTSPIDGVVVHWSAVGKGAIRLRLVRRDGEKWIAGPVSEPATVPAGDRGDWDTRLPIKAGDFLAVDGDRNNQVFMALKMEGAPAPYTGRAEARYWFPALEPGKESQSILIPDGFYEPLVSAVVEPDADGDGYGDETQDCAPNDAAVHEEPGCDTGTDPGTDPGTGTDTGANPGTGTDTGTNPGTGTDPGTNPGTGTDPGTNPGTGTDPGTNPGTTNPGTDANNGQASGGDPGSQPSSGGDPSTPSTDPTTTPATTDTTTTPPPDGFVYDYYYADPGTAADQWWATDGGTPPPGGYDPTVDDSLSSSSSSDGSSDSGTVVEPAAGGVKGAACIVPKLRGAKVKDAKATLRANGCRVGKIKRAKGRGVKRGRVLRQSRRAGKTLDAGTKIHLRVRR